MSPGVTAPKRMVAAAAIASLGALSHYACNARWLRRSD